MVGFYSGDPLSSQSIEAQGLQSVPSTLGETLGADVSGGFAGSLGPRIGRSLQRSGISSFDPEGIGSSLPGAEQEPDTSVTLSPEAANAKYGIKGSLSFDQPVTDGAAADIYRAKHADLMRQDVLSRAPKTFGIQTAASFVGGMLDPTNLALGLIPGVGEARVAGMLGDGVGAQLAGRAVEGATAGAAGMAATEPLNYLLAGQEHNDWSMSEALRDVAFGGLLGGGLHTLLGGLPSRPAREVSDRVEAAGPEARDTLLQGALGQTMDDRPLTVAAALDAYEAQRDAQLAAIDPRLPQMQSAYDQLSTRLAAARDSLAQFDQDRDARARGEAPDSLVQYDTPQAVDAAYRMKQASVDAMSGRLALYQRGLDNLQQGQDPGFSLRYDDPALNQRVSAETPTDAPQTMLSRLRELGGIQDQGGELSARDLGRMPGLVRESGMPLETAAERMAEEGYLPGLRNDMANNDGVSKVDHTSALLDAIDEERAGRPQIRDVDAPAWDEAQGRHAAATDRINRVAEELGVSPAEARGLSRGHVADILGEAESRDAAGEGRAGEPDGEADPGEAAAAGYTGMPEDAFNRHIEDLRAAMQREDAEHAAVAREANDAAARQSGTLADLQAQIAELEGQGRGDVQDPATESAQRGMDEAEQQAAAIDQAAACLRRSGI